MKMAPRFITDPCTCPSAGLSWRQVIYALLSLALASCASFTTALREQDGSTTATEIILATTTSTYDSGLLDTLIPAFESESGYVVKIVAVGTGQALQMGTEGNADILLVHAPDAELEFIAAGWGIDRTLVMHNDFVIVGPPEDPAGIAGIHSPIEAFQRIAITRSSFVSRGDDSGTHKKELAFWEAAGISPSGEWYIESGQGMAATLRVAWELEGYTLTDRSTYTTLREVLNLEVQVEGDTSLINLYHGIRVNPAMRPGINQTGAEDLLEFFTSPGGQEIIREFGIEDYGAPLFFPDAGSSAAKYGLR